MTCAPAKTQISLGIHPVWSESSLYALWVAKDPRFLQPYSEYTGKSGRKPCLIWVFAGCTSFCWFFHALAHFTCWAVKASKHFPYDINPVPNYFCKYVRVQFNFTYCNDTKFLGTQVWANNVDIDLTPQAVSGAVWSRSTLMILNFRTDRSWQTVQFQIRLLLEEQSDQGLHCLPFQLHLLEALLYGKATLFKFKGDYSKFSGVWNFRIFTVHCLPYCLAVQLLNPLFKATLFKF